MRRKRTYTVISVDDESGQVLTCLQKAYTPFEAMQVTAREFLEKTPDVQVVAAIVGDHLVFVPCEDSGHTAWAKDLAEDAL